MAVNSYGAGRFFGRAKSDSKGTWREALQELLGHCCQYHTYVCCCVAPAGEDHEGHPWDDSLAASMGAALGVTTANKSTILKTRRRYHVEPIKECT